MGQVIYSADFLVPLLLSLHLVQASCYWPTKLLPQCTMLPMLHLLHDYNTLFIMLAKEHTCLL